MFAPVKGSRLGIREGRSCNMGFGCAVGGGLVFVKAEGGKR